MKHRKIVVLKAVDEHDAISGYINAEVEAGATSLQLKYNGRTIGGIGQQYQQQVHIAKATFAKCESAAAPYGCSIGITQQENAAIVAHCGADDAGLYVIAHGTRRHLGAPLGGITGTQLGELVKGIGVRFNYICVVACEAGKFKDGTEGPVIQLCDTFSQLVQKPRVAGYGIPVFTVDSGPQTGRKQAAVMGRQAKVLGRDLRTFEKPGGQRTEEQKKDDKNMAQAKRNYKRVFVYANDRWIDSRAID